MSYKILIVLVPPFDPNAGGVQRSTFKMSSYFKSQGHDTHVFSFANKGHVNQSVALLHVANTSGLHRSEKNHQHLIKVVEHIQPDIVINQRPYNHNISETLNSVKKKLDFFLIGCLRNTLFTVKLNIENYAGNQIHKPFLFLKRMKLVQNVLFQLHKYKHSKELKKILDLHDYFVLFGPPNIDELKYFVGVYKLDKVHLIPNSILHVEPSIPEKQKCILWLGRLSYGQKRADLILPFWKKIMHQLPDWKLDIVGDGNAYDDIKNQIERDNLPRVKMYGKQVPDEFYKRSSIYIMTSQNEGFPNTLIEAQSYAAIPVIFDSYPIGSWVLNNGQSGILIPAFDIDKMAESLINLAKDEQQQQKLMNKCLYNAKKFEINTIGSKWIKLFKSALNKNK